MRPEFKPFVSGIPIGSFPCKFAYIVAGEQTEHAVNDKQFQQVTQSEKEQDNG